MQSQPQGRIKKFITGPPVPPIPPVTPTSSGKIIIDLETQPPPTPLKDFDSIMLDSEDDQHVMSAVMAAEHPKRKAPSTPLSARKNVIHLGKKRKVEVGEGCVMINCHSKRNEGLFCTAHEDYMLELYVKRSGIKTAGFGLFTGFTIEQGLAIPGLFVRGEMINQKQSTKRTGNCILDLGDGVFIDTDRYSSLSYYINDFRGSESGAPNVQIEEVLNFNGEIQFLFFAMKDIQEGEELLMDYGEEYWENHQGYNDGEVASYKKSCYFRLYNIYRSN